MEDNRDIEKFKELWYARNPYHENNADSGEDMFWGTAELVAREYVAALQPKEAIDLNPFKNPEQANKFEESIEGWDMKFKPKKEAIEDAGKLQQQINDLKAVRDTFNTLNNRLAEDLRTANGRIYELEHKEPAIEGDAVELKNFIVIYSDDSGAEIWTKEQYNIYVSKALSYGACPASRVVTHFNKDDSLFKNKQ